MMENLYTKSNFNGEHSLGRAFNFPDNDILRNIISEIPLADDGKIKGIRFYDTISDTVHERLEKDFEIKYKYCKEAFCIVVDEYISVYADSFLGKIYGAYSILQQSRECNGKIKTGILYAEPLCDFRGLKVYMPAPDDLDSFYSTIDMLLYYRYNKIIVEVGGAMEYIRHPEINSGWLTYCEDMSRYPERANEVQHMFDWDKNSIHFENGSGKFLKQDAVREMIKYCKDRGMEVIPEVPCLSHADYMLTAHPELAERKNDPYPDVYCPSNPDSYKLLFDIFDEVIDVFEPETVHIGHDEYYSIGICPLCKGKDAAQIFADDINKIHDYMKKKNIRIMLWSEKFINAIGKAGQPYGGSEYRMRRTDGSIEIRRPATYRSIDMVPKDIIMHHWYWGIREGFDDEYLKRGFKMVYGNFSAHRILDWNRRLSAGAAGGSPSHWSSLCKETLQRNAVLLELVYGAYLFWNSEYDEMMYEEILHKSFEELYIYKNRKTILGPHFEITHTTDLKRDYVYISSLPMQLEKDTIGHYQVTYEDGTFINIPIIYGLNITNRNRDWSRSINNETDTYVVDELLIEVSYTTLPIKTNEYTCFKFVVENPFPDKKIHKILVKKQEIGEKFDIIPESFIIK